MKILVIGKYYPDSFASHIYDNLEKLDHLVNKFEIPNLTKLITSNLFFFRIFAKILSFFEKGFDSIYFFRKLKFKNLYNTIKKYDHDLIIVTYDYFWPKEISNIKLNTNAKIVMWFPDAISNLGNAFFMVSEYDALFFKDPFIVSTISNFIKPKVYYLPECFNPYKHNLNNEEISNEYICDLTTAGNQHSWRVAFFENLKGYNIKFWGLKQPIWMPTNILSTYYQGKAVHNHDKAKAFLGSKIVINNLHFSEIWGLNVRCFEAAGIGAFQLVNWRPGIEDLFLIGEEIITFDGVVDLKNKIDYWLSNPIERKRISEKAKLRATKEHTYEIRLNQMISCIFHNQECYKIPNIHTRQ
jgi:spore maturation protein CgeB